MKKLIIIFFVLIAALSFKVEAKDHFINGGFGFFYTSLSPYGTWIELNGGLTVWRPLHVNKYWMPYKLGKWIWTNDGWYWDSYESFGYITYHYGRWYYDDYYGWIWIPDYEWAPAWVEWRYDNDYIGWAPLPPYAAFSINIGIHFTTNYYTPYNYWHFVKYRYMCDPYGYRHYVPSQYKYRIFSKTKYRTNYSYDEGRIINRGVDVDYIRERSGQRVVTRKIERVASPREIDKRNSMDRGTVRVYIPSREEITREAQERVQINRAERRSTLELSKVEIGRRTEINRGGRQIPSRGKRTDIKRNENERNINTERNSRIERERIKKTLPSRDAKRNRKQDEIKKSDNENRIKEPQIFRNKNSQRNEREKRENRIERRNNVEKSTPRYNVPNNRPKREVRPVKERKNESYRNRSTERERR